MTVINAIIFVLCLIAAIDIIWHDIRGKLLFPKIPPLLRHRFCVLAYSTLAGLTAIRAFVAAGSDKMEVVFLGTYYLTASVFIAITAVAIALEERKCEA